MILLTQISKFKLNCISRDIYFRWKKKLPTTLEFSKNKNNDQRFTLFKFPITTLFFIVVLIYYQFKIKLNYHIDILIFTKRGFLEYLE